MRRRQPGINGEEGNGQPERPEGAAATWMGLAEVNGGGGAAGARGSRFAGRRLVKHTRLR